MIIISQKMIIIIVTAVETSNLTSAKIVHKSPTCQMRRFCVFHNITVESRKRAFMLVVNRSVVHVPNEA
jgi:hypothetical protein